MSVITSIVDQALGRSRIGRKPLSPEAMLAYLQEHVYEDGECLLWAGPFCVSDEPRIMWRRQRWLARRLLITLSGRRLRSGDRVFDTCGNRRCMTLGHLKIGTHAAAHAQRAKQGAYLSGARRSLVVALGRAKTARLGIDRASEVFELRAKGWTYAQIGEKFGVHPSAVGHAIHAWRRAGITEWRVAA